MFEITKKTTITTDWAQLKTVQEQMNLAEIMLEVGNEFPISLEADADNENDVFEQLTAQVVHVTKEGRVMVVLKDCMHSILQQDPAGGRRELGGIRAVRRAYLNFSPRQAHAYGCARAGTLERRDGRWRGVRKNSLHFASS